MLRAILATFVLMTGVLAPRLAVPGDTGDTAEPDVLDTSGGADTSSGGTTSDSGTDTAADTAPGSDDTAGDPGFGAVQLSGEPGGCGCASLPEHPAPPGAPLALGVLGGIVLVLRRRRA